MIRPEVEALLQGALDDTLTPGERARLARLLSESREARERAAQLEQLTGLIDSLGAADAPPRLVANVLAQVANRPNTVRPTTLQRSVPVNKKILFGLAAAAAIVLAVITYSSNPPATEGTEATIGAAQRAQAPQIAASDVKLGDTSSQDVLQTETFDAIMKDETLRNMLQDPEVRAKLQGVELRRILSLDAVRKALSDPAVTKKLDDAQLVRALDDAEARKRFNDASVRVLLSHQAFVDALRVPSIRQHLSRGGAAALAGAEFQSALRQDRGFEAALKANRFGEAAARGASKK